MVRPHVCIVLLLVLGACLPPVYQEPAPALPAPEGIEDMEEDAIAEQNDPANARADDGTAVIEAREPRGVTDDADGSLWTLPQPVVGNVDEIADAARAFGDAWAAYDVDAMYLLLSSDVKGALSPRQFSLIAPFFAPREKYTVAFKEVEWTPRGYRAHYERGTDYVGWWTIEVPLVQEDGAWHVRWFTEWMTPQDVIEACAGKTGEDAEIQEVQRARALSASSCAATATYAFGDWRLCSHAVHDLDYCLDKLHVVLEPDAYITLCKAMPIDPTYGELPRSECIQRLGVRRGDPSICRSIDEKYIEHWHCLGETGAALRTPRLCLESKTPTVIRECLEHYIDAARSSADVCNDATLADHVVVC